MSENTVWRALKSLEKRKLIKRMGKPFKGCNRYAIITAKETAIESDSDATNHRNSDGANHRKRDGANHRKRDGEKKVPSDKIPQKKDSPNEKKIRKCREPDITVI